MAIIRNIPAFFKLMNTIKKYDAAGREIDEAKEEGDIEKEKSLIGKDIKFWTEEVCEAFDLKIEVYGKENLPEEDGLVIISNHQGYADIIALINAMDGRQLGFIAKDTLEKVPYIGKWISRIRGLFIKRGNNREALKSMREGIELVKQGLNLAIFPEGTRSQGPTMGEFKPGSFKLATKAKAMLVPVSVSGSYKAFEENGYAVPATIRVMFHEPIDTSLIDRKEIVEMEQSVPNTIKNGVEMLQAKDI